MTARATRTKIISLTGALLVCACAAWVWASAHAGCAWASADAGCAWASAGAQGVQSATLHVSLSPEQLGASTTIDFGFQIGAPGETLPPALIQLDVGLPQGMGIDTAGLAMCAKATLLAHGPGGCSSNAQVGTGSVYVKVPLGNVIRPERAKLTVFEGPRQDGRTTLLFYAAGRLPIATQLIFPGVIVPGPRGESIEASIPLIPTLPNAPDAAIVEMTSTLGTLTRSYHQTVGSRRVRFIPKGATIPTRCPPGGFPFSAEFRFSDASATTASTSVACPR
jgi:hypothetical protein